VPKITAQVPVLLKYSIGDAVNRQRNILAEAFLQSDCTHLLFVDSDTGFRGEDVLRWLAADKPVTVCNYPQRYYRWDQLPSLLASAPAAGELRDGLLMGSVCLWPNTPAEVSPANPFLPVAYGGTGMMLVRRDVFTAIADQGLVERLRVGWRFFRFTVTPEGDDRGEDYSFCDLVHAAGFAVYCDLTARANHSGLHLFEGAPAFNPMSVAVGPALPTQPPTKEK
jgi:hypothetical protein